MRAISFLAVGLVAGAGFSGVACGNGDDVESAPSALNMADASNGVDATRGGGAEGGGQDAGAESATDAEATVDASTPTLALLRMANWSADSPAVDFCLAAHGTGAFHGPILAARATSIDEAGVVDAGSGALPFPQATGYLLVDPAQYDARLVAAGAIDCSAGITRDATSLPPLSRGGLETLALIGAKHPQHGQPPLQIVGFTDDLASNLVTAFELRTINAAPDLPKVDLGTLNTDPMTGEQQFQLSVVGVPFGASSAVIANVGRSTPDPNGYLGETLLASTILAASPSVPTLLDAAAGSIVAQTSPLTVALGAIVTIVVVGSESPGGAAIVECIDNAGTVGLAGSCSFATDAGSP